MPVDGTPSAWDFESHTQRFYLKKNSRTQDPGTDTGFVPLFIRIPLEKAWPKWIGQKEVHHHVMFISIRP